MATPDDEPSASSETQSLAPDGQRNAVAGQPLRNEDADMTTVDDRPNSPPRPPNTTTSRPDNKGSSDNDDSDTDSSASDAEEARETNVQSPPAVEWLATGREKRSTAGNRLKHMLAAQEPDDELELLFAEDGDDAAFSEADEDGSDLHMDSSSDDEDAQEQGDDLEGEKELEKKAQESRQAARKRKAQEAIPLKFRKKVKIAAPPRSGSVTSSSAATPTTATAATTPGGRSAHAPRPKRKSERASWLPTAADMPTRASRRETTMMSKEQLHQQMIEREVKRIKQVEAMERKAKKLEALRKPPKTQAERLAEAAIIEKKNAKSLNRWEEAEKQREEERRAKLAALNNRTLDGPVVTFWSGVGEWVGGKLKYVGKIVTIEEKPLKKKRGSGPEEDNTIEGAADDTIMPDVAAAQSDQQITGEATTSDDGRQTASSLMTTTGLSGPGSIPSTQAPADQSQVTATPQDTKTDQSVGLVVEAPTDVGVNSGTPATSEPAPPIAIAQEDVASSVASTTDVIMRDAPAPVPGTCSSPGASKAQSQPELSAPPTTVEQAAPESSHLVTTSITHIPQAIETQSIGADIDVRSSAGTDLPPTADPEVPSHENPKPETTNATQDIETNYAQQQPKPDAVPIESVSAFQAQPLTPLNVAVHIPLIQPQVPEHASYTTMEFAPPPQLATAAAQEGNTSTSSFLAHPTGVNSNGLSIPQIGHITPSSLSTHGIAPPTLAAAPGSQSPLVSPGTTLPQTPQPQFRPVLSNVPVNIQSQATTGQQQPTIAALPPKPRGGRQKKEKEKEASPPPPPRTPPPDGKATRNCFILQNFNENAIKEKSVQTRILFGKEMNKLAKPVPAPRCVITGQPARYKDPRTGLPYYNSFAYKEIQKLQKGEYKFSSLLGTWMGSGSRAAAGVPARFLDPSAPGPPPPPPLAEVAERPPAGAVGVVIGKSDPTAGAVPADGASTSAPDPKANPLALQHPPLVSAQVPSTAPVPTPTPPVAVSTMSNKSAMTPPMIVRDDMPVTDSESVLSGTKTDSTQGQMPQVQPSDLATDTRSTPVIATEQALPREDPVVQQ